MACRNGVTVMFDLWTLLREGALRHSDSAALLAPGQAPLSHADLVGLLADTSQRLRTAGVGPADRVAVAMPGDAVMATAFLSVAASAVCVPLNPAQTADEFRRMLSDVGARHLMLRRGDQGPARAVAQELGLAILEIVPGGARAGMFELQLDEAPALQPASFNSAGDVALVLYTSGSTSRPKRVPLTHANLIAIVRSNIEVLRLDSRDRCLGTMPLFHISGLVTAWLSPLFSGGSFVCAGAFQPAEFFDLVAAFRPTWYSGGPTIHREVLERGDDYRRKATDHRFRFVQSASAPLPATTQAGLAALFDAPVIELYGSTEAGRVAGTPPRAGAGREGSVGRPIGCEVRIVDKAGNPLPGGSSGEIAVRGAVVTAGYEDDPQANQEAFVDGWFRTGDLGRFDEDGFLYIEGRLKDFVNRGGTKVAPGEVEEVMADHPAVAQAVAFPVPHPTLVEDLAAAVVLHHGQSLNARELRDYLFERLSAHKVPARVVFVPAIPKGPTGKVQRHLLAGLLAEALEREFVALGTDTERAVEGIWREALPCGPLGGQHNFFAIGGDSLRGARVVARLNERFELNLPIVTLFRHPELADFAAEVERARNERDALEQQMIAEIAGLSDEEVERLLAEGEWPSGEGRSSPTAHPSIPTAAGSSLTLERR